MFMAGVPFSIIFVNLSYPYAFVKDFATKNFQRPALPGGPAHPGRPDAAIFPLPAPGTGPHDHLVFFTVFTYNYQRIPDRFPFCFAKERRRQHPFSGKRRGFLYVPGKKNLHR